MMHEKFEDMELLRNSNVILDNIPHDLICIYCKKVLINAHQAPCGCKFCRKCIETLVTAGNELCPGNTEDCKENGFLKEINFSVDYRTNNIIYKLKVKCPNSNCNYECEFKHLDDHFNLCKKLIECKSRNGVKNEVNSNYTELSNLVNKLLESVNELSHQEDYNKSEINKLKEVIEETKMNKNSSLIELIQNEITKSNKPIDKVTINGKINTFELNGNGELENFCLELKHDLRKRESEIVSVNQEINVLKLAYSDDFKQQMEVHFEEKLSGFITEMRTVFEMELSRVRSEYSGLNRSPISETEEGRDSVIESGAIADPYIWRINELSTIYKEFDSSLDFFSQDKCYLFRMVLNRGMIGTEFNVDLVLVDEGCESGDGFPMNRLVKINILNQATNAPFIGFTRNCSMNKGDTERIFRYSVSDLPLEAVLKDDSIVLECII